MSWEDLHSELAEMFDDYSWRTNDYQRSLEEWSAWRASRERSPVNLEQRRAYLRAYRAARPDVRAANVARMKQWRQDNLSRSREINRQANRRQREKAKSDPVLREKHRARQRKYAATWRSKNLEQRREMDRRNAKLRRARQRAERQAA